MPTQFGCRSVTSTREGGAATPSEPLASQEKKPSAKDRYEYLVSKPFCLLAVLLLLETIGCGQAASVDPPYMNPTPGISTAPNLKVAFIGDQGLGADARAVLQLIANENAHMVIHSGDFDYADDPDAWDQQISSVLGASFPYFASIGNHDVAAWSGYQQKLQARLASIPGASCSGNLGVQAACRYQGLFFLLTGPGTMGSGHDVYIRNQLARDSSIWSVCSWHKNQQEMQVGGKSSEVGWEPYEECRAGGGIIATGHEHSRHWRRHTRR